MIIALKKETDPEFVGRIARYAVKSICVNGSALFLYITLFNDDVLHVSTSCHYRGEKQPDKITHYRGPAKDVKTGVIVNGKDVSIHVQKTRAFVTIANA